MCYTLQGVFAFTLLRKFIDNKFYAMIGTVFFIISPYVLQRMFGHTALAGNFLILMGICLWAYRDKYKDKPKKKIILWTLLLALAPSIHLYYVPMLVIIMICSFISEFIENRQTYKISIITFFTSCIFSVLIIYLLGGFTSSSYSYAGADNYNANLNTFFNPQGFSYFLKDINFATLGEYEGLGYLGLGILLMCFTSVLLVIRNYDKEKFIKILKKPETIFIILCAIGSIILAIGTSVKIGTHVIGHIPYPSFILKILGMFRASGRFIWVSCYIIFFACIYIVAKYNNKKMANVIIIICLMIQILDLYPAMKNKFEYSDKSYSYSEEEWEPFLDGCEHIACLEFNIPDNDKFLEIAHIALKNNCTMNNFYFAREIKNVKETEAKYLKNIQNSTIEDGYIYIIKKEDRNLVEKTNLYCYNVGEYIVITKQDIKGVEKIK